MLGQLTKIQTINLKNNQITALPHVFKSLSQLQQIKLDDNHVEHFPKALFVIDRPLSISVENAPMLNTILTTTIANKMFDHSWKIKGELYGDDFTLFNESKHIYTLLIKFAKRNSLFINDYVAIQQINNRDNFLDEQVQNILKDVSSKETDRIKNYMDLQERLASCHLKNICYVSCGDENAPINIFGCGNPMKFSHEFYNLSELEKQRYLHNLSFF